MLERIMNNNLLFIISACLLYSCSSTRYLSDCAMYVGEMNLTGNGLPYGQTIVLRPRIMEIHYPLWNESLLGTWESCGDTIVFYPKYGFSDNGGGLGLIEVCPEDSIYEQMVRYFIFNDKEKSHLIEITDWNSYYTGVDTIFRTKEPIYDEYFRCGKSFFIKKKRKLHESIQLTKRNEK